MKHIVRVRSVNKVTHDVLKIVTDKPEHYEFTPGQATKISINKTGWENKKEPFTFTSLPVNDYLEFIIKIYTPHNHVTKQLLLLKKEDELILHDVFGAIAYKGEGVFIAGGAGVTPFISIFRDLHSKKKIGNNKLIFANKTKDDIILKQEFKDLLGDNFINILSKEKSNGYAHGEITEAFLKENIGDSSKYFYVCGPPPMIEAIEEDLKHLKVDKNQIIKEAF